MAGSPRPRRRPRFRPDVEGLGDDADVRNARKRHRLVVLHRLDVIAQRREQARLGLRGDPIAPAEPLAPEDLEQVLKEIDADDDLDER